MIEILHDLIRRMTPHAVMGLVKNEKGNVLHVHEAMDQCI